MSEGSNSNSQQSAASPLSKELFVLCNSESLSEEDVREIIERHRLTTNYDYDGGYGFFRVACFNERVTEEIIRRLLEYFPAAATATDENGLMPLHYACGNKNMTKAIVQLIISKAQESVRSVTNKGHMPLHMLCMHRIVNEATALPILKLLIKKYPAAVRHIDNKGFLPIHLACYSSKSSEFCRVLIDAYPGSERITNASGVLPLHHACRNNSLATVEFLYRQHPEAIHHASTAGGHYPIHYAIMGIQHRDDPSTAVENFQFLLDCDPNQKLIQLQARRMPLLRAACVPQYNDSNIAAAIQIIKIIYDAHPEAIEDNILASSIHHYHQQVQAFINGELVYARQAKDLRLMHTLDVNGQLPLHTALQNNVRLGSIKLLVKGNPSALQTVERNLAMPLHIACQHHESVSVVKYLLGLSATILDAVDRQWNTALHYACRGAKHDTIALLLEKYDAASVSKRNAHGKLPIDLLWESNEVRDRESVEYMGSVFQLVRANPEMVSISNSILNQPVDADATSNGKKRKFGHGHEE